MPLNQTQVKFVGVSRQMVEKLIRFRSELDAYVLDYDNQGASALPTTAVALDDNEAGTAPRADAPAITGAQIQSLRGFALGMRDQISGATLNTLISVSVRSVEEILRQ